MLDAGIDLGDVPTERLEAEVASFAAELSAAKCEWVLMIGELDRRETWSQWECHSMAHWLSWHCGLSKRSGREHVRVARALENLPLVTERFASGALSFSKVRALTRLIDGPLIEAEMVELAIVATAAQLDEIAAARTRVQRLTDPKPERDHHQSWSLILDDDGGGTITIRASADVLAEMLCAVDTQERETRVAAKAGGAAGPPDLVRVAQGLSSRRVDALATICRRRLQPDAAAPLPTTVVIRDDPEVVVVHDCTCSPTTDAPAQVAPTGPRVYRLHGIPISQSAYERLRCDATIAAERTQPDGSITRTRTEATIPRALRRAVYRRDGACRFPACGSRASLHIHHIEWRRDGGLNTLDNLVLLCHYHHRSIHQRGWTINGTANRRLEFVGPDGRTVCESGGAPSVSSGAAGPSDITARLAERGREIDHAIIGTAHNEHMDLHWVIQSICDLEHVRKLRPQKPGTPKPGTPKPGPTEPPAM